MRCHWTSITVACTTSPVSIFSIAECASEIESGVMPDSANRLMIRSSSAIPSVHGPQLILVAGKPSARRCQARPSRNALAVA